MTEETSQSVTDMGGIRQAIIHIDDRLAPWRRYAGLLLVGALLLVYLLGIVVYSTSNLIALNGDLSNPQRLLPAVAARPVEFILIGLGYVLLGATVWFLFRTLLAVSGKTLDRYLRPAAIFGLLAFAFFVIYGLFVAIRLPWLASDYARQPVAATTAFANYLRINDALLGAANVALGGALLFACLGLIREKTFSRYLTLLGMFWGITAIVGPFPEIESPIITAIGQLCGFFWALGVGLALLRILPGVLPGGATEGAGVGNADEPQIVSEPSVTDRDL